MTVVVINLKEFWYRESHMRDMKSLKHNFIQGHERDGAIFDQIMNTEACYPGVKPEEVHMALSWGDYLLAEVNKQLQVQVFAICTVLAVPRFNVYENDKPKGGNLEITLICSFKKGQGLGSRMLKTVEDFALETLWIEKLELTAVRNTHQLYLNQGYNYKKRKQVLDESVNVRFVKKLLHGVVD